MSGSSRLTAAIAALAPSSPWLPQTPVLLAPVTPASLVPPPTPGAPLTPRSFDTFLDKVLPALPNNSNEIHSDQETQQQPGTTKKRGADKTFSVNPASPKRAKTSTSTSSSSTSADPAKENKDENLLDKTILALDQMYQAQLEAEKKKLADQLRDFKQQIQTQAAEAEKKATATRRELIREIRAQDKEIEERKEIEKKLKAELDALEKENQSLLKKLEKKQEEVGNLKQASAAAQSDLQKKQSQLSEQARLIEELKQRSKNSYSEKEVFAVINLLGNNLETHEQQQLAIQTLLKINARMAEQRGIKFFSDNSPSSRLTASTNSHSGNRGVNLAPSPSLSAGSRT